MVCRGCLSQRRVLAGWMGTADTPPALEAAGAAARPPADASPPPCPPGASATCTPACAPCATAAYSVSVSTTPRAPTAASARGASARGPGAPAPTCRCPAAPPTRVRTQAGHSTRAPPPLPTSDQQGRGLPPPSASGAVDLIMNTHAHTLAQRCAHKHACGHRHTCAKTRTHLHKGVHANMHTCTHM